MEEAVSAAEDLREAARLMRERAEAAAKGPWRVQYFGDAGYPQRVSNDAAELVAQTFEGGTGLRPTPEYIASMHPLVGMALAGWLDELAGQLVRRAAVALAIGLGQARADEAVELGEPHALRLARLYLGRPE
jgi:hypothetical protein